MCRCNLSFFCCLLLLVHAGWAQTNPVKFTSLTTRDGLVSNSINAVIKDHYGLMWFATDDGLKKFDGTNFTGYSHIPGDSSSLRANETLVLHEDKAGNLWIGTSGGGLSLYDRNKDAFLHFPVNGLTPELPANAVIRGICSDSSGKIWIAQYENLFVLDPVTRQITRMDLDNGDPLPAAKQELTCVFVDSRQRIWTGTTRGLYLYVRSTRSFRRFVHNPADPFSLANSLITTVAEDKSGNIWIGTGAGLCSFRPDGAGFTPFNKEPGHPRLSSDVINCIEPDEDGQLWIGTSNGLNIVNPRAQTVFTYFPEEGNIHSLTSRSITCGYIDQQGIYWFGTFRGGINKYDKNLNLFDLKLSKDFNEQPRHAPIISSFAESSNGLVFIGTEGGSLYEFNRKTGYISSVPVKMPNGNSQPVVLALHRSRNNQLYIGTYGQGLLIQDMTTGASRHFVKGPEPDNLGGNDVFCFKEDSKGNIWVGCNGEGVSVLNHQQVIARFTPRPNPAVHNEFQLPINGYIRSIEEDAAGNIWIGSHGGGIAVYQTGSGKWTVLTQNNSQLPSDKIQVIVRDSRENMWVGTYGAGLSLFDKKTNRFINFSEKDGLQNTTIYQIIEDLNGRLWFSTNTGISSLDVPTNKFRNYTYYNGVQNNNFVHGSGIRLSDGELMFGGIEGFNYFNPANLTVNQHVPEVLLTDLRVSNKSITAGEDAPIKEHIAVAKEIHLAYKQNFTLSFVALNYTIPKQNHYAYKLEGVDKDWNYTGTNNIASYTNLDPGEYTFHVKASNNDDLWSTKDTTIKIYVHPPFWRTIYAYIFYIAAFAGLLLYSRYLGITRLRKRFLLEQERQEAKRVQELDRLKIKFLTNLSHDFRTPISLIIGPVDQLITDERSGGRTDKLNMIKRNARRLLNLVNQLLDFRKMEEHELILHLAHGEFTSFVKEVSDSFRDFAERKHIHFRFHSDMPPLHALFDHDKIERILFNLLSNAFKFTLEGGFVDVELNEMQKTPDTVHKWVTITVKDSGIGIAADKKEQIFERFFQAGTSSAVLNQGSGIGLSITKEFTKMHGGTIDVESEPGKGATFIICLPLTPVTEEVAAQAVLLSAATATPEKEALYADEKDNATTDTGEGNHKPLVLLVEDNEDFRFYLKDNLRNHYKVLEAANGKEGWQKALAHHPQLIVSDISMPEMDGIDLVQKLKADKRTSHIPVILLTAQTAEEQQIAGLETGANDYITKPFNVEVLHARVKNLLQLNSSLKSTYTRQIKLLTPEVSVESADEKLLKKIVHYLEENLTNSQLSVENMSKEMGMSRSSLYNKVLELTGQTPVEYIRSYRLDKAASLMGKSDMTIAEIAYQVGFSTPNYFARSFKTKFNMLPSEYIAKMKHGNAGSNP